MLGWWRRARRGVVTRRPDSREWRDFVDWCRRHRLRPLPAHPWTVAAYARWCSGRHRPPTVRKRVRTIVRMHLLRCQPAPDRGLLVEATLRAIEDGGRAARPLFRARDFIAPDADRPSPPAEARPPGPVRRGLRGSPRLVRRRPRRSRS
jgi:hypothetical protein